jgi:alpha-galactosidase
MKRKIILITLISTFILSFAQKLKGLEWPGQVKVYTDKTEIVLTSNDQQKWSKDGIEVNFSVSKGLIAVDISSPTKNIMYIKINWAMKQSDSSLYLGDHWERSYGDLSWQKLNSTRIMPWYFMVFDGNVCNGYGVMTGCHSFASWKITKDSLSLILDTRNGTKGVELGIRTLRAAEIVCYTGKTGENAFTSAINFCKLMSPHPRLPEQPVYGINDWYFAYGHNSAAMIMETVNLMAPLAKDKENRPFCVIDDGWIKKDTGLNYNWSSNYAESNAITFGDMALLATKIKTAGMRPGIWTRPLCAGTNETSENVLSRTRGSKYPILDPTVPANMDKIINYFKLYRKWGYEMVKFDYTTYDILGKWGFQMFRENDITSGDWSFSDKSKTTAEVLIDLYSNIRQASGNMYLIGCNTVGHLGAGFFELQRIGDDTSGKEWARTLKMGVNTLAFRACQHNTFFAVDGDCVGLTTDIPWKLNKQWLQLLAESGTTLFISAQPRALGAEQRAYIEDCFSIAAKSFKVGQPLDWMQTETPSKWLLRSKEVQFDWGK